jgi:hypothetical protein
LKEQGEEGRRPGLPKASGRELGFRVHPRLSGLALGSEKEGSAGVGI